MIDVLVVDDDFRVAEINAKFVGKVPGFRVAARAHSAAQALDAAGRKPVDLILLDHYLPDRTGLELVQQMRELGMGADVIMITAAGDVETVFLMADDRYFFTSSRLVKEVVSFGGEVSGLVPEPVRMRLLEKLGQR